MSLEPANAPTTEIPVDRLALYFADGAGFVYTLDHYSAGNPLTMPRRTRALALALLDYAREQVASSEEAT